MPEILRINLSDPLYQKERELRNNILLRPLGIPDFGWEMYDHKAWHFVAMEGAVLIGCVLLVPLDAKLARAQLMQMAVDTNYQGKGVGKALIQALLSFARSKKIKEIEIHSRAKVSTFYESFGFHIYGEEFEEVGIRHQLLKMSLLSN